MRVFDPCGRDSIGFRDLNLPYISNFVSAKMEKLSTEQQDSLKKNSTDRLRIMAAKTGEVADDTLEAMDRNTLLEVVAKAMLVKKESEKVAGVAGARRVSERIDTAKELEMQMELRKLELERARLDAENRKMELEAERAKTEIESRRMELEAETERRRMEHEWRMAQVNRQDKMDRNDGKDVDQEVNDQESGVRTGARRGRSETLADRVKRYGLALKQVITPMSDDPSEIPQFFEGLEAMYQTFEVPQNLYAKLLMPFLSLKAKILISRLCVQELDDYEGVRDFLLSEFKLTPRKYKLRFDNATKWPDETFLFFTARLRNNLRYYLRSRGCLDDYDKLFSLLVSDKLKSCLPVGALNYVLSLEGHDWFGPGKLAETADTYVSNHSGVERVKRVSSAQVAEETKSGSRSRRRQNRTGMVGREGSQSVKKLTCFKCNEIGHVAKFCPKTGNGSGQNQSQPRCFRCQSTQHFIRDCPKVYEVVTDSEHTDGVQVNACFSDNHGNLPVDYKEYLICETSDLSMSDIIKDCGWEFGDFPNVEPVVSECTMLRDSVIKLSTLKFIDVSVNGVKGTSLVDSGAEIPLLSEQIADQLNLETCGFIKVRGIFSDLMRVPLVSVTMKCSGENKCENVGDGIQVIYAVAPLKDVTHDVVLPIDVVEELENLPTLNVMCVNAAAVTESNIYIATVLTMLIMVIMMCWMSIG